MPNYTYEQLERMTLKWIDENIADIPAEVRTFFFAKAFTDVETRMLPDGEGLNS